MQYGKSAPSEAAFTGHQNPTPEVNRLCYDSKSEDTGCWFVSRILRTRLCIRLVNMPNA